MLLQLIKKQWSENSLYYMRGLAGIAAIWGFILFIMLYMGGSGTTEQLIALTIGSFICGGAISHHFFKPLGQLPSSIRFLHLPATNTDKILLAVIGGYFIFLPILLLLFYGLSMPIIAMAQEKFADDPRVVSRLKILPLEDLDIPVKTYLIAAAVMAFGTVYFRRQAIMRTILMFIGISIVIELLNPYLLKMLIPLKEGVIKDGDLFDNVTILINDLWVNVSLPEIWQDRFWRVLIYGGTLIFWALSWLRLRETEVV